MARAPAEAGAAASLRRTSAQEAVEEMPAHAILPYREKPRKGAVETSSMTYFTAPAVRPET